MNKIKPLDIVRLYAIISAFFIILTFLVILFGAHGSWFANFLVVVNFINAVMWFLINLINRLRMKLEHKDYRVSMKTPDRRV
ncbi:cell division-associated protein YmgF [Escherichia fergusonii]|uniref:cell division-associated protein YmgF n=1 Tax=Escherichia fergusonii TaxID=564 RepID=UPI001E51DB17|nr:cell division-associated protein YmgF [Escherichia fergusonii]MCC8286482.1 hypothetical protein [Escherichia fergusonii]MCC8291359.1 hypothetical protein [Escherichia fergusonii]MCC8317200.1 hypothetical protein [Escherichia fergusonii]WGA64435.1 hypothetical protein NFL02_12045 [Escherichia fergusonii]